METATSVDARRDCRRAVLQEATRLLRLEPRHLQRTSLQSAEATGRGLRPDVCGIRRRSARTICAACTACFFRHTTRPSLRPSLLRPSCLTTPHAVWSGTETDAADVRLQEPCRRVVSYYCRFVVVKKDPGAVLHCGPHVAAPSQSPRATTIAIYEMSNLVLTSVKGSALAMASSGEHTDEERMRRLARYSNITPDGKEVAVINSHS